MGIPEDQVGTNVDELILAGNKKIICRRLPDGSWEIEASADSD